MQAYLRQLPLNEANALRSGGQVQGPQFGSYYTNNAAAAPIMDAGIAQGTTTPKLPRETIWLQRVPRWPGKPWRCGYYEVPDPRLKSNIVRIGTHKFGIGVYEYDIAGRRERGVMSTEVRKVMPDAVHVGSDGFDRVNYAKIGGI